jgi:5-methylcytosine-specific restriction endonuclease McrA
VRDATCAGAACVRPAAPNKGGLCGPCGHLARVAKLPPCSIEGCGKPGFCRGWCTAHYSRWQRHGDPLYQERSSPRGPEDFDKPKRCRRCREVKAADQFGRNAARADGKAAYCFGCNSAAVAEHNRTNPDRAMMRREYALRRRRFIEVNRARVTVRDLNRLIARYGGLCAYCPAPWKQLDHVVPVTRGGRHGIGNIVPACVRCNTSKNDRTVMEWRLLRGGPRKGRPRRNLP